MRKTKRCRICGKNKSIRLFNKDKTTKDRRQSHCRACGIECCKSYRKKKKASAKPFVYKLHWPDSGAVYFGSSDTWFGHRIGHHLSHMKNGEHANIHVQDYYNLFGPPESSVIGEYDSIEEAQAMEEFFIVSGRSIPYIVVLNIGAGTKNDHLRRLSKEEVFSIYSSDDSTRVLGKKYGVYHTTIGRIRRGNTYKEYFTEYHQHLA